MKIEPVHPIREREVMMVFTVSEGWAITAALAYYAEKHPGAAEREQWLTWAKALDTELRR